MVHHRLRVLVIIFNYVLLSGGLYDNGDYDTSSKIYKLKKNYIQLTEVSVCRLMGLILTLYVLCFFVDLSSFHNPCGNRRLMYKPDGCDSANCEGSCETISILTTFTINVCCLPGNLIWMLILIAPFTKKCCMLKCFRSLFDKQGRPRSDRSCRSSLMGVYTVCLYT